MLRVATKVAPSKIHGLGLFAGQRITKGTLVWAFDWPIDQRIPVAALQQQPQWVRRFVATYGYREGDQVVLCVDDARFFNHSKKANCGSGTDGCTYALRDIEPGEELTDDYETFDADFKSYADSLVDAA